MRTAGAGRAVLSSSRAGAAGDGPYGTRRAAVVLGAPVALLVVLMLLVVVRLPWIGDLGMHAATVERLRHDLLDPGDPLVRADAPSPYYSPWTVLLGCVARLTGLSVWNVLRLGAAVALALLVTGIRGYARTLSVHRAAPTLAVLCVVLLWGTRDFAWSGFPGLDSLALTVAYPSTLALGLSFHFWTLLTRMLRPVAGWGVFLGLGALWAVVLLVHQFTGVVASLGALAAVLGARAGRTAWGRLAGGAALGALLLWLWPYYDFFALLRAGGLEAIHRPLYQDPLPRYGLALLGVAALAVRARREVRDPLVLFFALGALVCAAGGLTGHWSWGRALPAVLVPAQLAAAVEVCGASRGRWRAGAAAVLGVALAVGAWAQTGTLGYAVPRRLLPEVVAARSRVPWAGYHWVTPWVRYGEVVMARTGPARQLPAYGAYTVAPGYPDVFLGDEEEREAAVRRYFAVGTSGAVRRGIVRRYGVRWVVWRPGDGVRPAGARRVASGPGGQGLYAVLP